ncbi:MAG: hypothetical protein DHS20C18_49900 [Saprospiraceae bacterium]|nr:MAG: hypothetical protein DHS20C18_49900 [Saprospiraceae bacterium]
MAILGFICWAPGALFAQNSWSVSLPGVGTFSSPRIADLNRDGIGDIIMGAGRDEFKACDSAVIALDGKTGELLWHVSAQDQVFGSAAFQDITGDSVTDIFIGGRSAELIAINGAKGSVIWRFLPANEATKDDSIRWFNFYNPQFIPDQNGDGLKDILVSNGGDVLAAPHDPNRPPGYLLIINAQNGELLKKALMPDQKETYMSVTVSPGPNSTDQEILFGTGGETIGGNFYLGYLSDVILEDLSNAHLLHQSSDKGYIGPSARVDLNQDGILDIVTNSVNGRLLAFDGQNHHKLWEVEVPGTESYSSVTIGYFTPDTIPDVFVSYGKGIWPNLGWNLQIMVNGETGKVAFTDSLGFYQNTTPLAVDLNNDGLDEILMSVNFQEIDELYQKFFYNSFFVIEFKSGDIIQIGEKYEGNNLSSTPWIGDLDGDQLLDIIYCHGNNLRHTYTFDGMSLHRIATQIPIYKKIKWGAYQGSNYDGIFRNNGTGSKD